VLMQLNVDGIKQVVWNLLRNAAQAMNEAGQITVSTKVLNADRLPDGQWSDFEEVGSVEEGKLVRVVVADNGPGIAEEVTEHLFEPFFTTKKGGTGLGLATSYRIVEDHDGVIGVQSSEMGTSFVIDLPLSYSEGEQASANDWQGRDAEIEPLKLK